jgi:hypothetical protein
MLAILLTFCLIIPGLIYYLLVIRKLRQLQNVVVTTTPREVGCDVVVTYPSYAQRYVDSFFAALPDGAPQRGTEMYCTGCGREVVQSAKFCTSCGSSSFSPTRQLPPG